MPLIPVLGREKHADILSLRPVKSTKQVPGHPRLHRNPVSVISNRLSVLRKWFNGKVLVCKQDKFTLVPMPCVIAPVLGS